MTESVDQPRQLWVDFQKGSEAVPCDEIDWNAAEFSGLDSSTDQRDGHAKITFAYLPAARQLKTHRTFGDLKVPLYRIGRSAYSSEQHIKKLYAVEKGPIRSRWFHSRRADPYADALIPIQ